MQVWLFNFPRLVMKRDDSVQIQYEYEAVLTNKEQTAVADDFVLDGEG